MSMCYGDILNVYFVKTSFLGICTEKVLENNYVTVLCLY